MVYYSKLNTLIKVYEMLSNIDVKKINKNKIFRYINEKGVVSRPEISKKLGLSGPTVLQNVNELITDGFIIEAGEMESTGGRKAIALTANKDKFTSIGIDITKRHVGVVVTNLSGEILYHNRIFKIFNNKDEYYLDIAALIEKTKNDIVKRNNSKLVGVGISIPGIINEEKHEITQSDALGIYNTSYDKLSYAIHYESVFVNDANSACYAEIYKNTIDKRLVYISLSNTVGGAFYNEGKLYLGNDNHACEFGHSTLYPNGKKCYCGKNGCLDAYCSVVELTDSVGGTLEDFFCKLEEGNKICMERWDKYLNDLAVGINSLRMIFDCMVIVGGYVGSFIDKYLEDLRDRAKVLNTFENSAQYIKACTLKIEASAVGAAYLANEKFVQNI